MISKFANLFGDVWERVFRDPRVQLAVFRLIRLMWLPFLLELRFFAALAGVFSSGPLRKAAPAVRRAALLYLMVDGDRPKTALLPFRFDLPLLGLLRATGDYRLRYGWVFFTGSRHEAKIVEGLEDLVSLLGSVRAATDIPLLRDSGDIASAVTVAESILEARNRDIEKEVAGVSPHLSKMFARMIFFMMTPPVRAVVAQRLYDPSDSRLRRMAHSAWQIGGVSSRLREGVLREQLEKAGALDPAVFFGIEKRTVLAYGHLRDQARKIAALRRLLKKAGEAPVKALVVIPHCRHSGAARVAAEVCHALVDRFGADQVLLLQTDLSDFAVPQWFPKAMRRVDFYGATREVLPIDARRLLVEFIRSCAPEAIFNVNSGGFWRAYTAFGSQLSREMRIYSYFFCSDRNAEGREVGYPVTYFAEALLHHAGIFFDSRYLREQMEERFRCAGWSGTTAVLYTPAGATVAAPVETSPDKARKTIFWCGRLDPQKRFDLVIEIAKRLPECDFRVWGKRILGSDDYGELPANLHLEGVFADLGELPLADFDLWLFTSAWEGIPTILLDLAAAELPLVSSYHTGLTDLLEADGAFLVESFDPDDYVAAIRAAFSDPEEAGRRAGRLREKVASRHKRERFAVDLLTASGFGDEGKPGSNEESLVGDPTLSAPAPANVETVKPA